MLYSHSLSKYEIMRLTKEVFSTLVLVAINYFIESSNGENILFFHPVSTYSHRISVWPLVKKLVEKGHQITFISPFDNKTPLPNVTDIKPEPMSSFVMKYIHGDLDISKRIDGTQDFMYNNGGVAGAITCQLLFESPEIQRWLGASPKYDLVVVDWFFSECGLGLAYKFKAKTMFYASSCMIPGFWELLGVVPDTASVPEYEHHYPTDMTFLERVVNTLQPLIWRWKLSGYYTEITNSLRKQLNLSDMPHIKDLAKNVSLVLWSEEVIDGYPMAITPNFVRVGGMHCQEKINPLPKNLEEFVRKSDIGFVYISLGSGVNLNNLPAHYQDIFLKTIKSFPNIQFVWKWSDRTRFDSLTNLHIGEWFPQQDILGHPKLLAFITQAGKPSIQESICHGAPVIAMPVFADQDYNADRMEQLGVGITLQIATLTESGFKNAIDEMANNKMYKEKIMELSKLYHDRPMKPADTALWWTEYVLRHDSVHHLRSLSMDKSWLERRHLDVWFAIAFAALVIIVVAIYVIKCALSLRSSAGREKVKSH